MTNSLFQEKTDAVVILDIFNGFTCSNIIIDAAVVRSHSHMQYSSKVTICSGFEGSCFHR